MTKETIIIDDRELVEYIKKELGYDEDIIKAILDKELEYLDSKGVIGE